MDPPRPRRPPGAHRHGVRRLREAAQGRIVDEAHAARPADRRDSHPLAARATDVDRMGHVNNAAYWSAVEHRLVEREPDLRRPHAHGWTTDTRRPRRAPRGRRGRNRRRLRRGVRGRPHVKAVAWVEQLGSRLGLLSLSGVVATLGAWTRGDVSPRVAGVARRARRRCGGFAGLREAEEAGAGPAGVASGLITCVLAPEQTEGPYYVDDAALRRDVRGPAGDAHAAPHGRERVELQAHQGRGSRDLALRRGGVLGDERAGHGGRAIPPRRPAHRREGPRDLQDDLCPAGTRAAPCTSTRWCTSAATSSTRAALLLGRRD